MNGSRLVQVDGIHYRVTQRPYGVLVYKRFKTGEYKGGSFYKFSLIWNSCKNYVPSVGSTLARVLAAADD